MGTKCILRGNEMHFVGSKSLYVSLCPLPGSVQFYNIGWYKNVLFLYLNFSVCPNFLQIASCKNQTVTDELRDSRFEKFCR